MILAFLPILLSSTQAQLEAELAAIIDGKGPLPALAAVQEAAVLTLSLSSDEEAEGWASRARWRGLLPRFDVRFGTDQDLDVRGDGLGASELRLTRGRGLGLDLQARFELSNLVFNDQELRASRARLARSAAINLARERVTKIYFERLRILLKMKTEPSPKLILEAARLDGLLRALTAGRLEKK